MSLQHMMFHQAHLRYIRKQQLIRSFFAYFLIVLYSLLTTGCGNSVSTVLALPTTLPSYTDHNDPSTENTALPSPNSESTATVPQGDYSGERLTENPYASENNSSSPYNRCGQSPWNNSTITIFALSQTICSESMQIAQLYLTHLGDDLKYNFDGWTCGPSLLPGFLAQCINSQKSFVLRQD